MCEHLQALENYLKAEKIPEIFRGQAWSDNCREWVYFDCILDSARVIEQDAASTKIHLCVT